MVVSLFTFAMVLHGTLPASEPVPRFGAAYQIVGFADYFKIFGHVNGRLDARMSWFGLLSATGMAAKAMGVSTSWFLRWAPTIFELAYLVPLKSLATLTLRHKRASWAALPVFLAGNWIDQDYFSPQAVGLFIYLAVLLVALRTLGDHHHSSFKTRLAAVMFLRRNTRRAGRAFSVIDSEDDEAKLVPEPSPKTRLGALLLVLLLLGVLIATHPLTPVVAAVVLLALALTGRTRLRITWLLVAFGVIAWLSWAAKDYWIGHLQAVFGGLGNVGGTVQAATSQHTTSTSLGRRLVEDARIAATAITWLGAGLASLLTWRRRGRSWELVILAVAPGVIGALVTYGGEIALRILLFSLPALAILIGSILDSGNSGKHFRVPIYASVLLILVALFPLTRYGNEGFEAFTPGDIASANWLYLHVPVGSTILTENYNEPLGASHAGAYRLSELGGLVLADAGTLRAALPQGPAWIYLTNSEYTESVIYLDYPRAWLSIFETRLEQFPFVHLVYRSQAASVYYLASH